MIFLFVVDVAAALAFAYFLAAVLRPPTRPGFLISVFVLVWANLVFVTEVLSLLHLVTAWGFAAAHVLLGLGAFLLWRAEGRPLHPRFAPPSRPALIASLKSWPDLWAFGLVVGLGYALLAVINLLVPPNNLDSMVYHLPKVAHWIRNRSLAPWLTPCLHQTLYPFNVEIGSLWSMIFLHRDALAGFVQWFSALAALVSVFGLARAFGFSRPRALFAGLVYFTLPMIVLQATTTQNDLATAAMTAAMAFLLVLGLKTKHRGMLALSGAALGLAIGMKLPTLMILPGFALAVLYMCLAHRPRPVRPLLVWGAACLAGFVALGAFNYVQSWVFLRHHAEETQAVEPSPGEPQANDAGQADESKSGLLSNSNLQLGFQGIFSPKLARNNVARDVYSFLDATGLPRSLADPAATARARAGRFVFSALHLFPETSRVTAYGYFYTFNDPLPVASEAGSFFGPLGFFLILPLVAYGLVAGLRKRDMRLVPALAFIGFMLLLAGGEPWQPFRGRYYCAVVALIAPLAAALYRSGPFRVALRALIIAVASLVMIVTVLTNVQKPLVGPDAIWTKSYEERRTLRFPALGFPYAFIDKEIPPDATVAAILRSKNPEYPLFGPTLGRNVVPVFPPPEVIDSAWLARNPFDYVVVNSVALCKVKGPLPPGYRVTFRPPYSIIIHQK